MSNLIYNYSVTNNDGTVDTGQFNYIEVTAKGQVYHGNDGDGKYPVIASYDFEDIEGSSWSHIKQEAMARGGGRCTNPYDPCP